MESAVKRSKRQPFIMGGVLLWWLGVALACSVDHVVEPDEPSEPQPAQALHPEEVLLPEGLGTLESSKRDSLGRPLRVACSTCHDEHTGEPMKIRPEELGEVHRGLILSHGELRCGSCHAEKDRDKLRLSDGRTVAFAQVMVLCGQCHGPQLRDYKHGAHGGMQGYWDRRKGPRTRNNCVICHDAHAPAILGVMPAPGPRDRFLPTHHDDNASQESHHD